MLRKSNYNENHLNNSFFHLISVFTGIRYDHFVIFQQSFGKSIKNIMQHITALNHKKDISNNKSS